MCCKKHKKLGEEELEETERRCREAEVGFITPYIFSTCLNLLIFMADGLSVLPCNSCKDTTS